MSQTKKEKLQAQIKELQEEIASMPEENKRWRAEKSLRYWFRDSCGEVGQDVEHFCEFDDYKWITGNYYKTQELCEKDTFLVDITALRDHVLEVGIVEEGEAYMFLVRGKWEDTGNPFLDNEIESCYSNKNGEILPATATEEQKTERLRLIKKLINA